MKTKVLFSAVLSGLLLICAPNINAQEIVNVPSLKVQTVIDKFKLKMVDYNYVKEKIVKGTRDTSSVILIDARPEKKFKAGTVPTSINIPDTEYDKYVGQLKDVPKDKEILVFCGGWNCGKSPKVAGMLKKDGFTNVKLYQAGEPDWSKKDYLEVDKIVAEAAFKNNSAVLIDARPYTKFLQETIPGSISIPDTEVEKYLGRFPRNENEKIIVYCGGFKCTKSHTVANVLVSMGYKNVSVFAGGLPEWKKSGLVTTKSAGKVKTSEAKKGPSFTKNGAKLSIDEGGVDGEWFYALYKDGKVPEYIQIVDIRSIDEYNAGHLKGAINIEAEKITAKEIVDKLPKGKTVVFHCSAGGRSVEAWQKVKKGGFDISEILYFDANIDCKGTECKVEVNEPIG